MRRADLGLLAVGVAAVSTAAPLVREADAPALALASWRTLLAAVLLTAFTVVRHRHRRGTASLGRRQRRLVVLAGLLLAAHFGTWIPSIGRTTVASSVALVSTQPVWAALIGRWRGEQVTRASWVGIALAVAGVLALTGVDVALDDDALVGDALALVGGVLAAAYFHVGAEVRRSVPTLRYTTWCYAVAGVTLGLVTAGAGDDLTGFDGRTWAVIVALAVGPQLLGHSVFNHAVAAVGATVVSVAVLLEVVGAALLAWWWQGEVPPAGAVPAGVLILVGIAVVVGQAGPRDLPERIMAS